MSHGQILKAFRLEHDLTNEQIAEMFGMTRARWNQYEHGDSIPLARIREMADNKRLPEHAQKLVMQLWLSTLEAQFALLGEHMQELGEMVSES